MLSWGDLLYTQWIYSLGQGLNLLAHSLICRLRGFAALLSLLLNFHFCLIFGLYQVSHSFGPRSVRPSVPLTIFSGFCSLHICWQITWKKWHKFWHADVSRWFTLGRHRCRWVLLSFHAFVHPCDHPGDWVWVLQTNRLDEMVYNLACWCIQMTCVQFIDACGYYCPSVHSSGHLALVFGWAREWLLPSLGDTGDICCHYWQHILVIYGDPWLCIGDPWISRSTIWIIVIHNCEL